MWRRHSDDTLLNLFDSLKAQITGDKLTIGEEDLKIYFPSPNHVISFNRSLLKNDLEQFEISILSKDSSIYFANDDKGLHLRPMFKWDTSLSRLQGTTFDGQPARAEQHWVAGPVLVDGRGQMDRFGGSSIENKL
ncbi:hypothetical protein PsorP6_004832 [Peronosclerospora sorghi]|uniref:Uncharacterized protein n=1 Tax=Peronosclerospora sorghi TaxID=230839 RepID=A0ACC0VI66_9STRA|nr:hypothetical protein PsorP6_004832 [Peronosclerospora sorghi]